MSLQVVNLAHLAYLIRSSTERFIKLELEWDKVGQLHYSSQFASGLASKSRTLFWACRLYKSGRWDLLLLCRFLAGLQLSVVAGVGCSLLSCMTRKVSLHMQTLTAVGGCAAAPLLQVVYIDHDKAKDCEEQILEVNAVPAAHSKGLLERPHPCSTPSAMVLDASQQGGADNSDVSDDEVAEASNRGRSDDGRGRSDDGIASKL